MQPNLTISWPAILVSVVAAFIFGWLWYGPLFGKSWAKEMGLDTSKKPDSKVMTRALALQLVGIFLTAYVLTFSLNIWRPSVWGYGGDAPNYMFGLYCGFFVWIGFYVPMQFGKVSWENRSWKLFFINTVHDFLNLQIICQILANLR